MGIRKDRAIHRAYTCEAGRISREDLKGAELQFRSAERSRKQEGGVVWHQCKVYSFHNDAHAAYGNNEE